MKNFLRISSVICLISWMGLIFYFSSQTAEQSSRVSGETIITLAKIFYPDFASFDVIERQEVIDSLQGIVRTMAHFCIYAGLGFFSFLSVISYTQYKFKTRIFWMFLIGSVYSLTDEIHQNFVRGRSMQLTDILIDCLGVITALLICWLFVVIVRPLYRKVKYEDRSKELMNLNNELYEKLDNSMKIQKELEQQIEELKNFLERSSESKSNENLEEIPTIEDSEQFETQNEEINIELAEKEEYKFEEDFDFAARVIGKTVVTATKICNELTLDNNTEERHELVNLILGRTEVLKAEILNILKSEAEVDTKKQLILSQQDLAYDYFNSIKAQIS